MYYPYVETIPLFRQPMVLPAGHDSTYKGKLHSAMGARICGLESGSPDEIIYHIVGPRRKPELTQSTYKIENKNSGM